MQRYFAVNENLDLGESDIHHITKVMRMSKDDKIVIIYNQKTFLCNIDNIANNQLSISIIKEIMENNELEVDVTIGMSLLNENKFDLVLQKVTELGGNRIIPLETERSIVNIDAKKENKKLARWEKICKEASEQSHRVVVPSIDNIINVKNIDVESFNLKLLCSVNEKTTNVKEVLQKARICDKILIVIGPEGGFTDKEEEVLINKGFTRVSLGKRILRAETAPIFVLSVINYEYMR